MVPLWVWGQMDLAQLLESHVSQGKLPIEHSFPWLGMFGVFSSTLALVFRLSMMFWYLVFQTHLTDVQALFTALLTLCMDALLVLTLHTNSHSAVAPCCLPHTCFRSLPGA